MENSNSMVGFTTEQQDSIKQSLTKIGSWSIEGPFSDRGNFFYVLDSDGKEWCWDESFPEALEICLYNLANELVNDRNKVKKAVSNLVFRLALSAGDLNDGD